MRISVLTVPSDSGDMLPYAMNDDIIIIQYLKPFCQGKSVKKSVKKCKKYDTIWV